MPQLRRGFMALIAGAALIAPMTSALAASYRSPSFQELYLQNTQWGTSQTGTMKLSYRSAGHMVRRSCAIFRCAYRVPTSTAVTLSQSSQNPSKYRFQSWMIQAIGSASPQYFKKPRIVVVMSRGYTATAVYTVVKR